MALSLAEGDRKSVQYRKDGFYMIENIRNNDNSYKKGVKKNIHLPKNIRQVGQASANKKIYIEDYVMTYIQQLAMKNYGVYHCAVLLGEYVEGEDGSNIFISGAIGIEQGNYDLEKIFTNESWAKIYDDVKRYFKNMEIVGWYVTRPGLVLDINKEITAIHVNNFAGTNKVLFMYDSVEKEEVFYVYSNGALNKQGGYFIYYEKNESMQNYMVDHKEKDSIESGYNDSTSKEIRSILENKRKLSSIKKKRKNNVPAFYVVTSIIAVFLLVIAANLWSNSNMKTNQSKEVVNNQPAQASDDGTTVNVLNGGVGVQKEKGNTDDTIKNNQGTIKNSGQGQASQTESPSPTIKPKETPNKKSSDSVDVTIQDTDPIDKSNDSNATSANTSTTKQNYYIVKKGDTLASISRKYYNTIKYIAKIKKLNNLENENKIYEGQKLQLP